MSITKLCLQRFDPVDGIRPLQKLLSAITTAFPIEIFEGPGRHGRNGQLNTSWVWQVAESSSLSTVIWWLSTACLPVLVQRNVLTIDTFDREFINGLCFLPPVFRPLTGLTQQPSHCHRNSDNVPNSANLKHKHWKTNLAMTLQAFTIRKMSWQVGNTMPWCHNATTVNGNTGTQR